MREFTIQLSSSANQIDTIRLNMYVFDFFKSIQIDIIALYFDFYGTNEKQCRLLI